jgi:hypothetical protein
MRPQTIGRALGVGVRLAGRMAGQQLSGERQGPQAQPQSAAQPVTHASSRGSRLKTGNLGRGLAGFFKPFTRVGGIVLLEVTGVFFLIFVLVFGQMAWRARTSYATGPDHNKFLAAAALSLVFLYLCVSSFWRARKR